MGPPRGPFVLPGTYTVKVASAGKEVSQTVVVEDDPRITATDAERRAWHAAQLEAGQTGANADAADKLAKSLKKQLEELKGSFEKKKDTPEAVTKGVKALLDKVEPLARRLTADTPMGRKQLSGVAERIGTNVNNPVDLGLLAALDPERYIKESIRIVARDPNVDMMFVAFTGPPLDDDVKDKRISDLLLKEIAEGGKPTVICGAIPTRWPRGELRFIEKSNVPVYPEPRRAVQALAKLAQYSEFVRSAKV